MKKILFSVVFLALMKLSFAQTLPWRPGEMELRINFKTQSEPKALNDLHLNTDIYTTYAYAYVVPSELEVIKKSGLDYDILKPDLNAWSASFGDALVPSAYYTFSQIKDIADSLASAFPSICKKVVFGQTATSLELAALKISDNVNVDENEPEILFDGGIHGDEIGGSQNMIMFARDLCRDYGTNTSITDLIDNREIWIYYCVNPWGRNNMSRYNSNGIDVNRDFGYMWGYEGNSPSPFSQLESRALRKCKLENQFASYTNFHSGTEIISYPWSNRVTLAPDNAAFLSLAQVYANNSGYASLSYGQGSIVMYLIQGATKDFDYGSMGSVGWSIEISYDKQPPANQISYYYNINKPAMLALIEHCGYGIQGQVTDAVTGQPVGALIFVGNNYPSYSDNEVGDYHKYLPAGMYTLTFVANGYAPKTITGVSVAELHCTQVDVALQPMAGHYAYKVITTHIPNFNGDYPGDELYSAACLMASDQVSYSLGKGGYIVVDMQDTIFNADGPDVIIYEGDSSPEGYTLYAGNTMDGPWVSLGNGTGTTSFDLNMAGIEKSRYFKILDDNNGVANVNDAGFEFDAIASLHPAIPDTTGHLTGILYDGDTGLPIFNGIIYSGDSSCVSNEYGHFSMTLPRGENIVCAWAENFGPHCDTLNLIPAEITDHDFVLFPNVGMNDKLNTCDNSVIVYPNPSSGSITIVSLQTSGISKISLINLYGKTVRDFNSFVSGTASAKINVSDIPSGVYFLKVTGASRQDMIRIVISR